MAEHGATVTWHLAPRAEFTEEGYNRDHEWTFPGGEVVAASASPHYSGAANRVSPEEAVIAALSSCHMLTFLALAARKGLKVLSYVDTPMGALGRTDNDRTALVEITLRPRVVFSDDSSIDRATFDELHDHAHQHCFIANTLNAEIKLDPVLPDFD